MRVSIITITDPINYGAVLQSFALYKYIKNIYGEAKVIQYNSNLGKKEFLVLLKERLQMVLLRKRISRCKKFEYNHMEFTDQKYKSFKELLIDPPQSDLYVVGSDQVWNSDIFGGLDPAFFLDFVAGGKKISYASSIGKSNVSDSDLAKMKAYLQSFNAISVRESSAKSLLEEAGLVNVEHVLDPVFLLDKSDYFKLLLPYKPYKKEKYLLLYGFDSNKKMDDIANIIAGERKLKIVEIGGARKKHNCDKFLKNLGPEEFLSVLEGAEYVITSSFHGTAFSIIFGKSFVSVLPSERGTRIESILSLVGLENRLIKKAADIKINELMEKPDYHLAYKLLGIEISKSKEYLDKVINDKRGPKL